jgi:hypothetical protein
VTPFLDVAISISKPKALEPVRAVCPVCGKTAYSRGGIHPQCAAIRADKVRRAATKATAAATAKLQPIKQWTKRCPSCHRVVPARRVTCDCGHNFQPKGIR